MADKRFLCPTDPDAACFECGEPINPTDPDGVLRRIRGICKTCRRDEPPPQAPLSLCRCHFCSACNSKNAPVILGTSADKLKY